jgi:zinc transport system permease protein
MNIFEILGEYFQYSFVRYALIVGVLIALCASVLGTTLVLKRFSYIGDGLSHLAFGAMAVAVVANITDNLIIILPTMIVASVLLLQNESKKKIKGDSAIAMVSVGALAFGYFIINKFSVSANIAGDVCSSLFGATSILTLQPTDVWVSCILSLCVVLIYFFFYNKIFAVTFDTNFMQATGGKAKFYDVLVAVLTAFVISISMRLVGSLLVAALIVFPPLSSMRVFRTFKAVCLSSAIVSVICAFFGIIISILIGTPVGATIVITNIFCFLIFYCIGIMTRRFVG